MVCRKIKKYESKNKGGIKMQPQLTENLRNIIAGIVNVESNDTCNENANMSSMTPAGQMMKFASEVSKIYALENLVSPRFKEAHEKGLIHIHDLDFYSSLVFTFILFYFSANHQFSLIPLNISN